MGGASSYYSILRLLGFYVAIWIAAKASRFAGISSIVLEIATGVVLGPQVGGLIPGEYSICEWEKRISCAEGSPDLDRVVADTEHNPCDVDAYAAEGKLGSYANSSSTRRLAGGGGGVRYDTYGECLRQSCIIDLANRCQSTPNILTMIGHTGVAMMIFESGMHFDFHQVRAVGPKACVVAVAGTLLPLVSGAALVTYGYGFPLFPDGVAAGTALAPTSVGIALRLLHEARVLDQPFGQTIITAAFVDDILSLVLFNILFSMGGGSFTFVNTLLPALLGCIFMALASVMAVMVWPKFVRWLLSKVTAHGEEEDSGAHSCQDAVLFLLMVAVLIAHAQITNLCGTHLWGCFTGGMSFALVPKAHRVWVKQTKRIAVWMMRTFFAATVAFAIPVDKLLSPDALWKGAIMGIGPCILTKVLCAPFMGRPRFVIGWAMVGRAEFAYLIAQMAVASNLMDPECFSIVIWSLLWATIFAPFLFRILLQRYIKTMVEEGMDMGKARWKTNHSARASAYLGDISLGDIMTPGEEEEVEEKALGNEAGLGKQAEAEEERRRRETDEKALEDVDAEAVPPKKQECWEASPLPASGNPEAWHPGSGRRTSAFI